NIAQDGQNPGDEVMFSVNTDPFGDFSSGWSSPLPIAYLYDVCDKQIRLPDGSITTLGARYPIARQPLLDDYGNRIRGSIVSAYPWISLDGLNVMFTTNR